MALIDSIAQQSGIPLSTKVVVLFITLLVLLISYVVHALVLSPYAHIPGPLLSRLSNLPLYYATYKGTEATTIARLHAKYGSVVLIAPNEVSVSDGRALKTVYTDAGGFRKADCYRNFDIDGFPSIFSELERGNRAVRFKSVSGLFSTGAIRDSGEEVIKKVAKRWIAYLRQAKGGAKAHGQSADVLKAARAFALDAVTGYLFGECYGALEEIAQEQRDAVGAAEKISASLFVDSFVAVGRFFYLPSWVFTLLETWSARLAKDKVQVEESMETVDGFVGRITEETAARLSDDKEENSYQARMLKAGISKEETKAQCKDLMFAGTDSTGMNLATICWYLAKDPEKYTKLRAEALANPDSSPQSLPYLTGIVKEGLRLSMANPTRMPRVVPSSGYTLPGGQFLPPSTVVGLQPYTLHHNPAVFPSPNEFIPERWDDATPEMLRDSIPFGLGSRACIARNLATVELYIAVDAIVRDGLLEGASPCKSKIEILEWFNSKVIGEKIEIRW
ncbi:cytochrome P450 [Mytilinidion resinicola]|uniref:Cytochrome P450 n=1 Tax=Mytilinidion resinicola TaxID=574789 RepID=A0A6A6YQ05_9PEZI|nr:cytochrome P450 [Mytilinidion resinicola]KAF2810065.1 cytochrome P450 [Mytilinidion resinicola]